MFCATTTVYSEVDPSSGSCIGPH